VKRFIEKKNNIKLCGTQIQLLKAIIRGDVIYTSRGMGRSLLYNGYADYLKQIIAKDTDRTIEEDDYDSIFTLNTLRHDDYFKGSKLINIANDIKEKNLDMYNREFECHFSNKKVGD
jgi:hypothetical protein